MSKPSPSRVAARYQKKKEVPKADGSGTTTVYEYGPRQVSNRNKAKAERVEKLRARLPDLRSKYKTDLGSKDPKERLTALAVALIDLTYERVGNEGSAKDNGHYGVTTWEKQHVTFPGGKARITYTGKSGVKHVKEVTDAKAVAALKKATQGKSKGDRILCDGDDCRVLASDVNAYLKEFDVTAKDLRGLHANEEMRASLQRIRKKGPKLPKDRKEKDKILKDEFKQALEAAAEAVGHEAATLKSQYLVPGMEDAYLKDGSVLDKLSKTSARLVASDEEVYRLWKLLDDIDTADDIAKGNEDVYRNLVRKYHAQRHDLVSEERLDSLYERFHPKEAAESIVASLGLPRLVRLLEASGIDPWNSTRLPYGVTTVREAAVRSVAARITAQPAPPKWEDFASRVQLATKSRTEVEDEEAERLVRESPKKKPPRRDLERRTIEKDDVDRDPDEDQDRKDRSNNYKDASAARVARLFVQAKVSPTESGKFKAERPDSEVPRYFDEKEEAEAWVEGNDGDEKDEKKEPPKEKEPTPEERRKAIMSEVSEIGDANIQEALKGFSTEDLEVFAEAVERGRENLAQKGPPNLKSFLKRVETSKTLLENPENAEPEMLAAAVAAVEYHEKVLDNPLAETDPEVGPLPDSEDPPADLAAAQKQALDRAYNSVEKYRGMDADGRKDHAKKIVAEINKLPEGSEKRLHLEAIEKGIAVASAIEDGDQAEGIGAVLAQLTKAAEKGGNLKTLMGLGSVNSTDALGDSDQAVLRKVYADLTDDDWSDVIAEDHPGRELADLLSDPEQSQYLTPDDIAFIREHLQDMMLAEAAFLDPIANRQVGEGNVGEKGAKAKAARAKAVPELEIPSLSAEGDFSKATKAVKSWITEWAEQMAGLLKKTPKADTPAQKKEEAPEKKERKPGDVWKGKGGQWWAKDQNGNITEFKSEESAKNWADGESQQHLRKAHQGYDFTPWGKVNATVSR